MTIQDALERAKQLRKTRDASFPVQTERPQSLVDETGSLAAIREPLEPEPARVSYPELPRLEIDPAACEASRVLYTDEQLTEAGRGAATYRMLRGRVQQRVKAGNWTRLGITSPGPSEGKSVTAINLALSIAREKQRTVYLLDLDMRNPSVLRYLGAVAARSLADYFTGNAEPGDVLYATDVDRLIVAGAQASVEGASELLASRRVDDLLKHVRRRSPDALVIVDLPPVMSTDEALVVAPRVDAMFLVVSEGKTRRDTLVRSMDLLSDFNVAGVIINRSTEVMGASYYEY
jgi:capsular exopolysaccharide synthesis family protein